jgi:predicted kinase
MEKRLILVRGIPGSGKSTFARSLGGVHYEADMFFLDEMSNYVFDVTKIKDAHSWCQTMCESQMKEGEPLVVISNTFTQEWEMKTYLDMALRHGYTTFTIVVENRHGGVNTHGVPEDKLQMMKGRFEISL